MKKILQAGLRAFTLLVCVAYAQCAVAQQAENMTLLGNWDDQTLRRYSDLWGYASSDGQEYALLGSFEFIHVLNVTDPANIREVHRLNSYANSGVNWRDIKVYGDYAYCVIDDNKGLLEGLQIIDLRDIENTASEDMIVFSSQQWFGIAHNIFIDETANPARLYAFGTDTRRNGYIVLSLENPAAPTLLADLNLNGNYVHDAYVVNDTLYANHGNNGMFVYDVELPLAPTELGRLTNYLESGYNHSVWRTPDGQHAVMCDETTDTGVKVVDVSNPLDMEVTSRFRSTLSNPSSSASLAHNPYVLDDDRVVISYYGDGIQVWDISDRATPTRLGYYDTTPNSTSYGNGIWGAYPFLPSGNILGSDILNGLFVVSLNNSLPVSYASWEVGSNGKDAVLEWSVAAEYENVGWSVEHALEGGDFAEIAFVEAGRTDNEFVHRAPGPGKHYYRLRQRDADGSTHLSEVRTLAFSGLADRVGVFPNPAPRSQPITLRGVDRDTEWELWSADGRLVRRGQGSRLQTHATAGIYFLQLGGEVVSKVVITE